MKYKICLCLLLSSVCQGLLHFPKGTFTMQGKILKSKAQTYLVINYRHGSEVRLLLQGNLPESMSSQVGSNAEIKFKVSAPFFSRYGEAEFKTLVRYLDPQVEPQVYLDEEKLPKL